MEKLNFSHEVTKRLCQASGKYALFIAFDPDDSWDEVIKAAPLLTKDDLQILSDGCALFLFDTEEETWQAYNKIVGDDGPTELNPYAGPVRVYALTFDANGQAITENT